MDSFIAFSGIIGMAVGTVWLGSKRSVEQKGKERIDHKDAYLFPVIASCALFGLYLAFKFLPQGWVNFILLLYFGVVGVGSTSDFFSPFLTKLLPSVSSKRKERFTIRVPFTKIEEPVSLSSIDMVGLAIATAIWLWYGFTKNWVANNIIGISFSIIGVSHISSKSYTISMVLLWLLFGYDIFWVFHTEVMVYVATSFDAPIKLLMPKFFFTNPGETDRPFTMLGLGDIVIPGIFIALMMRFDAHMKKVREERIKTESHGPTKGPEKEYPKRWSYFSVCFAAYATSLITTIVFMVAFHAAQPALLYIVPACTGSVTILALIQGEFKDLLAYSEGDEEEKEESEKKEGSPSQTDSKKDSKKD